MPRGKKALYLLPFILALFLVASELVERSMYNDGVAYAGLSKNLAHGIGDFWNPKLSEVEYVSFHEHPPLIFGLQSLFFRVLGDGLATERIYAGTIFLLSGWLIVLLWREALRGQAGRDYWFVPLTLWLANEVVYHFYPANVLEPTMALFALGAVYACLRAVREGNLARTQVPWTLLAGVLLVAGSLSKGFVALFPLGFFGLHWLVFRRITLGRAVALTALLVAVVVGFYAGLLQFDAPRDALGKYFDSQVMASLTAERTYDRHFRSSRFYLMRRMLELLIPAIAVAGLVFGVWYRQVRPPHLRSAALQHGLLFLLIGVSASLPLIVSLKQSFYYLLPAMGYYALGLGLLIAPAVAWFMDRPMGSRWSTGLAVVAVVLLLAAMGNTARHWGGVTRRDRTLLHDVEAMNTVVERGATIGSAGDIRPLVVYMYRMHGVSIDTAVVKRDAYPYLVAPREEVLQGLREVPLGLEEYRLYRVQ